MNNNLKHGDILIIGSRPFMIIKYHGSLEKEEGINKCKFALLDMETHDLDCFMEEINLKIGEVIFGYDGDNNDETAMRLEMIIPSEKVTLSYKL